MEDTPPEIKEKMHALFRTKTLSERLEMGCSMYDTSRALIIDAIVRERPNISSALLRRELFLRFYGEDFEKEERERIVAHLMGTCSE